MRMLIKHRVGAVLCASLCLFSLVAPKAPGIAQEKPSTAQIEKSTASQDDLIIVLENGFRASRFAEIYADLRRVIREFYLPSIKNALHAVDKAKFDPETRQAFTLLVPLLEYSLKAAEELDPVLEDNRDAMIRDVAALFSKHMSKKDIQLLGEMLQTPAMRKGFNAFFAFSRIMTGYTREDLKAWQESTAWMKDLELDLKNNPFTEQDRPPPPRERVEKAEAIVSDFMRISRVDDMVAEIVRFNKEVVLQIETLTDSERDEIRTGVEQLEFFYNLGKGMAVAVAPSALASTFDDEQLGKLHLIILSPVISKSFGLLYGFVREATSFTKLDLNEFHALAQDAEKFSAKRGQQDDQAFAADRKRLAEKWQEIFSNALTPETKAGLEQAFAEFLAFDAERKKRKRDRLDFQSPAPGAQEL